MERKYRLEYLMKILRDNMQDNGILAIAIFDRHGNPVAYAVQDGIGGEELSARGGGLLSTSLKVMESLNMAPMERAVIETGRGIILLEYLKNELGIILVASPGISVGRARLITGRLVRKIMKEIPL